MTKWGVSNSGYYDRISTRKYLGLPFMIGVDHVDCFKHLIERIQKIVSGWKERTLYYGGKEALTKAVAQAIP